jgi:hypothetical protein
VTVTEALVHAVNQVVERDALSLLLARRVQQLALAAGSELSLSWNRAVLSPGFTGGKSDSLFGDHPWAFRRTDMMDVTVPFFTDADGHTMTPELEQTSAGSTTIYQDGTLLGTQQLAGRGTFWVGQGKHDYRLVTDVTRDQPWQAQIDDPADGFVSLRTRASDTEGNTIAVTVIRAYQVS